MPCLFTLACPVPWCCAFSTNGCDAQIPLRDCRLINILISSRIAPSHINRTVLKNIVLFPFRMFPFQQCFQQCLGCISIEDDLFHFIEILPGNIDAIQFICFDVFSWFSIQSHSQKPSRQNPIYIRILNTEIKKGQQAIWQTTTDKEPSGYYLGGSNLKKFWLIHHSLVSRTVILCRYFLESQYWSHS